MRKPCVFPGQQLLLLMELKGGASAPKLCTALSVQPGMISVVEPDSGNGLAKVVIHSASWETGTYHYEYKNFEGRPEETRVKSIHLENGEQLKKGSWFTER